VSRAAKILQKVLSGTSDANVKFADLRHLLSQLGFEERIRGSHHIFSHPAIPEILNLQPRQAKAKRYQVKQIRQVIQNRGLAGNLKDGNLKDNDA
jgi:predicted RNA binding protein YcfA (HicA-like mRNA interferase family)